MASSDDEAEVHPQSVSNYHFEDDEKMPVSFSELPIRWSESEDTDSESGQVFLDGVADNGLQKIYRHVIAWKFDVSGVKPEISVLLKGRQWVKLEKPKKCFEGTIRTIISTVYFLHYVQKNPDTSAKSVLGYLSKVLSHCEVMPSLNDLLNHLPIIREAVERNAILTKSKLLLMLLEKPGNVKVLDEVANNLAKPDFIVDDYDDAIDEADDVINDADDELEKEDVLFDSVCVLCDNGGNLLCCDGICMRSFHATVDDDDDCDSLGLTQEEVEDIQSFICENCEYNQHQCFVCCKLGNSNKSSHPEVFKCDVATCCHFYHLHCVAKELGKNIADGESFVCPIHSCCICKEREDKQQDELQFAVCRRCPTAYHRKCLPREIAFDENEDDFPTRAWPGLLPNKRILIYCLKHELDEDLGTPTRDHVQFPKTKRAVGIIDSTCKRTNLKASKLTEKSNFKMASLKKESGHIVSRLNVSRKRKANYAVGRRLPEKRKAIFKESRILSGEESQVPLGQRTCDAMIKGSKKIESGEHETYKRTNKELRNISQLDSDTERRLLDLFKEATSLISLDDVSKKLKFSSAHASSLRTTVEKSITAGKLEGSVDAVRTALRRLDEGKSLQDATSVCDLDVLKQIFKWRDKLKVYLAPVLNGNRYTSYGRHFTSLEKLEGIVDRLHWYAQSGDTIVDFSCGANDFSILMKKKLEETGKQCFYKNYDLFPTKNDFHFEMRDWMDVKTEELPKGSRLIMGLNPPFGVNGKDAELFINKALKFRPKLLVLTVPKETKRPDNGRTPYDLIWEEDENFLSGKSYYLPGSLDVNDKQMDQWNHRPPVLYVWSRHDWTDTHKVIAEEHGHVPSQHAALIEKSSDEISPADHIMDGNHVDDIMLSHDPSKLDNDPEGCWASRNKGLEENFTHGNLAYGNHVVQEHSVSKSDKSISNSDKISQKQTEENADRERDVSPTDKQAVNDTKDKVVQHSQQRVFNDRPAEKVDLSVPVSPHEVKGHANKNQESTSRSHKVYERASRGTKNKSRASSGHSRSDYRARNSEEHRPLVGSPRSFEYRHPFRDEQHWRETDVRQQIRAYGIQDQDYIRSRYQSGDDPTFGPIGTTYGRFGSDPRSSFPNTSTMQRYAPRLDGSNHVRTRTLESEPPIIGRNGNFDSHVPPQPGYGGLPPHHGYGGLPREHGYGGLPPEQGYGGLPREHGYGGLPLEQGYGGLPPEQGYGGPLPQPGYGGSTGFMYPHNAYSRHHSGWLNE